MSMKKKNKKPPRPLQPCQIAIRMNLEPSTRDNIIYIANKETGAYHWVEGIRTMKKMHSWLDRAIKRAEYKRKKNINAKR